MEEVQNRQSDTKLQLNLNDLERALISKAQSEPSVRALEKMIADFSDRIAELIDGIASASQQFGIDQESMLDYAEKGLMSVVENVRNQRDLMGHLMQIIKSCRSAQGGDVQFVTLGATHILSFNGTSVKFDKDDLQKLNNCSHPMDSLFVKEMDELVRLILAEQSQGKLDSVELF